MKLSKKAIFLGILIFISIVFGLGVFTEFLANHPYYSAMFQNKKNRILFLSATLISIGILYNVKKNFKLKKFIIRSFIGTYIFGIIHMATKGELMGFSGIFLYFFNQLILFSIAIYFFTGVTALGTLISNKFFPKTNETNKLFISLASGLGSFLIVIRFLIQFDIFFSLITRILLASLFFIIKKQKSQLNNIKTTIEQNFQKILSKPLNYFSIILLIISIMYFLFGFQMSFIPYSTAWDANHAYMYFPKIRANANGVIRNNAPNSPVGLWHSFIAIWFSFRKPLGTHWLAPDTIAVSLNFRSGILVLISFILLSNIFSDFITKTNSKIKSLLVNIGRTTILLRLLSGMGAFLVFVDNKTDLGVMFWTIIAITSGILFLYYRDNNPSENKQLNKETIKYLIFSGIMFTLAGTAKPTAFIDLTLFAILLIAYWLNGFLAAGFGLGLLGVLSKLHFGQIKEFISDQYFTNFFLILGGILILIGIIKFYIKKDEKLWNSIRYLVIWGLAFVSSLLIIKLPGVLIQGFSHNTISTKQIFNGLIMSSKKFEINKKLLFAANVDTKKLLESADETNTKADFYSCKNINYTEEQLKDGLKRPPVRNEDVGRYIGYGRKELVPNRSFMPGYSFLRIFFHKDGCRSFKKSATLLCENADAIKNLDIQKLQQIKEQINPQIKAYGILENTINFYKTGKNLPKEEFSAQIQEFQTDLELYYKQNTIKVEGKKIYIPYKMVVPLNIIFNRSVQNLSSYYTDIGFIWFFAYVVIILSFFYSLLTANKKLQAISLTTILGRLIWRYVGGAILRYGIGLIIWTGLVMIASGKEIYEQINKKEMKTIRITAVLFAFWVSLQFIFNFIRISSQGSGGPFVFYKQSVGKVLNVNETLSANYIIKMPYTQKDVFDLQFPHFNIMIQTDEKRKDKEGILIAGTYLQYFLKNQHNVKLDGMLTRLATQFSDGNMCKTYHRLLNANLKYLVIDPNIATVVMGQGNETLFYRFFAQVDNSGNIIKDGVLTMLTKMIQNGYANFYYSNYLAAKYGMISTDAELKRFFGNKTKDQLIILRAKMLAPRFFPEVNQIANFIGNKFVSRIGNFEAIQDLADMYGKIIDSTKLKSVAMKIVNGNYNPTILKELTNDERFILMNFLYLHKLSQSSPQEFQSAISNIVSQAIASTSMMFVVELK